MKDVTQLKDYEPKSSHHIFLDANILLYAFAPIGDYKARIQEQIANFLQQSRSAGASLYVTSLVLSEFYNRVLKSFFDDWKMKNPGKVNLKTDFRPSAEYRESIAAINSSIKSILKFATCFPDGFNAINTDRLLSMCYAADFNDAYFLELAAVNKWMILTRDRDLIDHPMRTVQIITNLA